MISWRGEWALLQLTVAAKQFYNFPVSSLSSSPQWQSLSWRTAALAAPALCVCVISVTAWSVQLPSAGAVDPGLHTPPTKSLWSQKRQRWPSKYDTLLTWYKKMQCSNNQLNKPTWKWAYLMMHFLVGYFLLKISAERYKRKCKKPILASTDIRI